MALVSQQLALVSKHFALIFQPTPSIRPSIPRAVTRKVEKETEFSDQVTTYTKPVTSHKIDAENGISTSSGARKESTASQEFSSTEKMNEDIDMALAEVLNILIAG